MLAPSSFTRMSHKAPWSARYRPDLARSGQLSGLAARVAQTGCAHKCRPCPSPLPPLPDALLPAIGPAQTLSPPGKCSCLSLLQVLALPPVLRQKQGRVPAERPASRFQPAGSSAWLVFQTLCRLIWPPGRARWNTKALARQPTGPVPHPWPAPDPLAWSRGGAQDPLPAVRHAQGSSSQTSRGEAQEPDPGASARPAPAAFKKKP